MDSDGFTLVKYSKRSKRLQLPILDIEKRENFTSTYEASINYSREVALRKIKYALGEVKVSDYFASFWKELHKAITCNLQKSVDEISRIVCYGLGSICRTTKSIEQFALLTNLQKKLKIPMEFYDPMFTDNDKSLITEEFNFEVIQVNEEGSRTTSDLTIFYLPHCPHALCNNLIFANWDPLHLKNCIIISNGFSAVIDNAPNPKVPPFNYIRKAKPCAVELNVINNFVPMDVFNDFAIHVFPPYIYNCFGDEVWNKSELSKEERRNEDINEMVLSNKASSRNII